jgi:hypothetical protein
MRVLAWIVGTVLGAFALFGIVQWLASERVEVVQLHSKNDEGEVVTTRLWVVDHEGYSYLRAGEDSGWYARLTKNPNISLERNGKLSDYRATPNRDKTEIINNLMNDKYTWGDDFFALLMDRSGSVPIELQPR